MTENNHTSYLILEWRSLGDASKAKDGDELEVCLVPMTRSRFALYSVRTSKYVLDPFARHGGYVQTDCRYRVRDAETVGDREIAHGVRPSIVWEGESLNDALTFCQGKD